jgi:rhodanese-related sulfurtransferase
MINELLHFQNKLQSEIDSSDLLQAMERGEKIVPVDARTAACFEAEHIAGAISLPHREMNEASTILLEKKDTIYAVYCDGVGCNASTKGAYHMARLGFKVRELIGGLAWWNLSGYPTEGTKSTSEDEKIRCDC